ncbi:MAG TPA: 4Fe-4S dicluster domain-containing protein [Myxococcota bacterium]|nr:4Fe-4S dicluster domain-containing protein [Myxococcota bacterium]
MIRGYRGFLREFSRTGSARAFWLQVRTGAAHILRTAQRSRGRDAVALFLENYREDGVRLPDAARDALRLEAQRCTACGLCTAECARVGGAPRLDPMDVVAAASRLAIDIVRLALPVADAACLGCAACEAVCPAHIPIARVKADLGSLGAMAQPAGIR